MKKSSKSGVDRRRRRLNQFILCVLSALVWVGSPPTDARADIIYTWHEDDGQNVTGSLEVLNSAQPAGQITASNVVSFAWTDPYGAYNKADMLLYTNFPIPISTTTAEFTAPNNSALGIDAGNGLQYVNVQASVPTTTPSSMQWYEALPASTPDGFGHWTISQTSTIPEPSTITMALIALATGLGCTLVSRRGTGFKRVNATE